MIRFRVWSISWLVFGLTAMPASAQDLREDGRRFAEAVYEGRHADAVVAMAPLRTKCRDKQVNSRHCFITLTAGAVMADRAGLSSLARDLRAEATNFIRGSRFNLAAHAAIQIAEQKDN